MAELSAKAKQLGISPERYVKNLLAEDLALDREARTTSFHQMIKQRPDVDDDPALDDLVERARNEHHRRTIRRK